MSLCYRQTDYGISVESEVYLQLLNRKSPYVGAIRAVKRLAAHASLQRPINNQILTPLNLYDFCEESVLGITFIYVASDEVDSVKDNQKKCFSNGNPVVGTETKMYQ